MTIAALGISVRVGTATLLSDVSVEVGPGEVVAVAGPNGAGKSTLIGVLAGDIRLAVGRLMLEGQPLAAWPSLELARRRAVMGTDPTVAFGFNAEEVALMGRLPFHGGKPREVDRAIARRLLEAVDCAHLVERVFATLSTGERQRVTLARALAQVADEPMVNGPDSAATAASGPSAGATAGAGAVPAPGAAPAPGAPADERYLLLDEPVSSLDPAHQHVAMRLLRHEADGGRGVLAVLHDLNLAAAYADRLVLMAGGRVVAAGTPEEVLRPDLLESVFGIAMLVIAHERVPHPLVIAEPRTDGA